MAEQNIRVAIEDLAIGRDDDIGPKIERALTERGKGGVVRNDQSAGLPCPLRDVPDIANIEPRIRGRFDPDQPKTRKVLGVVLGRWAGYRTHSERHEKLVRERSSGVVAI